MWSGIFTAGYIGNLCRVTRSLHGHGLATVSGERAWFCPRFAPLPEWLLPPPARGHPVSSRGRIERHGTYEIYRGSWAQQGTAPGASTRRGVPIWDASIRLVQWHSPRGLEIDNARDSGVLGPCGTSKQGSWEDAMWGGAGAHSATRRGGGQDHPHRIFSKISLSITPTQDSGRTKCLQRTMGSRIACKFFRPENSFGGSRGVPVLVPVRASPVPSPVPSVVRGSFVKFFCARDTGRGDSCAGARVQGKGGFSGAERT